MKNLLYVQHPGEVLREELEFRGITGKLFSTVIGKSVSELSELLNKKRNLTAKWAILIGEALNISPEFWLGLQKDYDLAYEIEKIRKGSLEKVKNNAITYGILEKV
ncbi:MAG: HigA family addiction module antitoxin [Candidatus Gracilibacteria bacterium]|nr:HigA family addiction module antitoxin [Candidatus Gracilibacteria bacterium]